MHIMLTLLNHMQHYPVDRVFTHIPLPQGLVPILVCHLTTALTHEERIHLIDTRIWQLNAHQPTTDTHTIRVPQPPCTLTLIAPPVAQHPPNRQGATRLPPTPDSTRLNISTPNRLERWEHDTDLDRNRTLRTRADHYAATACPNHRPPRNDCHGRSTSLSYTRGIPAMFGPAPGTNTSGGNWKRWTPCSH